MLNKQIIIIRYVMGIINALCSCFRSKDEYEVESLHTPYEVESLHTPHPLGEGTSLSSSVDTNTYDNLAFEAGDFHEKSPSSQYTVESDTSNNQLGKKSMSTKKKLAIACCIFGTIVITAAILGIFAYVIEHEINAHKDDETIPTPQTSANSTNVTAQPTTVTPAPPTNATNATNANNATNATNATPQAPTTAGTTPTTQGTTETPPTTAGTVATTAGTVATTAGTVATTAGTVATTAAPPACFPSSSAYNSYCGCGLEHNGDDVVCFQLTLEYFASIDNVSIENIHECEVLHGRDVCSAANPAIRSFLANFEQRNGYPFPPTVYYIYSQECLESTDLHANQNESDCHQIISDDLDAAWSNTACFTQDPAEATVMCTT